MSANATQIFLMVVIVLVVLDVGLLLVAMVRFQRSRLILDWGNTTFLPYSLLPNQHRRQETGDRRSISPSPHLTISPTLPYSLRKTDTQSFKHGNTRLGGVSSSGASDIGFDILSQCCLNQPISEKRILKQDHGNR